MYRPNFCADCGGRVERRRWRVWTSRRFCATCERRVGRGRLTRVLLLCALLVAAGFALGRAGRERSVPLVVERAEFADAAAATREGATDSGGAAEREGGDGTAAKKVAPAYGPDGTEGERPTDPSEVVSICGARTQKGTPCSRRVRGTGRCWQHRGRAAMLPPGKLVVPN